MMQIDKMIAVLQAHKEGKKLQCRFNDSAPSDEWSDSRAPSWQFDVMEYRVKPEPKEVWINYTSAGTVAGTYYDEDSAKGAAELYKRTTRHFKEVV